MPAPLPALPLWHRGAAAQAGGGGRGRDRAAVSITTAPIPPREYRRSRTRQYLFTMSLRITALVVASLCIVWWNNWIAAIIIAGLSVPLPWIAVIRASEPAQPLAKRSPSLIGRLRGRHTPIGSGTAAGAPAGAMPPAAPSLYAPTELTAPAPQIIIEAEGPNQDIPAHRA